MRITALVASFNRQQLTVKAITSFVTSAQTAGCEYSVVLVDDGSSDGTVKAVQALGLTDLTIEEGDGSWFWARSMARAEVLALKRSPDYLFWLNDDVVLSRQALTTLLSIADGNTLATGPVVASLDGRVTYAGYRLSSGIHFRLLPVRSELMEDQFIDAANGNVLLVRRDVALRVGGIDAQYAHAYADLDYVLRAKQIGISCVLAGVAVGTCEANPRSAAHYDPAMPLRERWRHAMSVKGLPVKSQARFMRRHAGFLWPVHFVNSYRRVLFPGRVVVKNMRPTCE